MMTISFQHLAGLENKEFAFACIGLLKDFNCLSEKTIQLLTNRNLCCDKFQCSGFPILNEVSLLGEPTREDCFQGGRRRFYQEKIVVGSRAFVLTNHWYGPNSSMPDCRTPFLLWVLAKVGRL